jgi:hypothetical protein
MLLFQKIIENLKRNIYTLTRKSLETGLCLMKLSLSKVLSNPHLFGFPEKRIDLILLKLFPYRYSTVLTLRTYFLFSYKCRGQDMTYYFILFHNLSTLYLFIYMSICFLAHSVTRLYFCILIYYQLNLWSNWKLFTFLCFFIATS